MINVSHWLPESFLPFASTNSLIVIREQCGCGEWHWARGISHVWFNPIRSCFPDSVTDSQVPWPCAIRMNLELSLGMLGKRCSHLVCVGIASNDHTIFVTRGIIQRTGRQNCRARSVIEKNCSESQYHHQPSHLNAGQALGLWGLWINRFPLFLPPFWDDFLRLTTRLRWCHLLIPFAGSRTYIVLCSYGILSCQYFMYHQVFFNL